MTVHHSPACVGTKVCKHCKRELTVLAFGAEAAKPDGLRPWCRHCESDYGKRSRALKSPGAALYHLDEVDLQ